MELADWAAAGHQDGLLKLYDALGGWSEVGDGFVAGVSGVAASAFNNVTVYADCDPAELIGALGRVAASGLPFSLQARPGAARPAALAAAAFAMVAEPGMPMMGLTGPSAGPTIEGLTLRRLGPDDTEAHAAITAAAFHAPVEVMRRLTPPEAMSGQDAHFLAGELGNEIAATAMVDVNATTAWLYLVATVDTHRRRGLGAAVTAAAVRTAFANGAKMAFLLSSPMGVRVYEGIGFRELEWWSSWDRRPDM